MKNALKVEGPSVERDDLGSALSMEGASLVECVLLVEGNL